MTQIRALGPEELPAVAARVAATFTGARPSDEEVEARLQVWEQDRTLGAFDDGSLVATAATIPLPLTLPGGRRVPAAGISRVTVLPTHRRRGLLTEMLRRQIDEARDQGELVAGLFATEGGIYGRFGFGVATLEADLRLARGRSAFREEVDLAGLRLVDHSQAAGAASADRGEGCCRPAGGGRAVVRMVAVCAGPASSWRRGGSGGRDSGGGRWLRRLPAADRAACLARLAGGRAAARAEPGRLRRALALLPERGPDRRRVGALSLGRRGAPILAGGPQGDGVLAGRRPLAQVDRRGGSLERPHLRGRRPDRHRSKGHVLPVEHRDLRHRGRALSPDGRRAQPGHAGRRAGSLLPGRHTLQYAGPGRSGDGAAAWCRRTGRQPVQECRGAMVPVPFLNGEGLPLPALPDAGQAAPHRLPAPGSCGYRPLNWARGFSPNAVIPSSASSDTKTRASASRSSASPRSSGAAY